MVYFYTQINFVYTISAKTLKNTEKPKQKLSKICYWFIDENKHSFRRRKNKMFGVKHRPNKVVSLDIKYSEIKCNIITNIAIVQKYSAISRSDIS